MTAGHSPALQQAVAAFAAPALYPRLREHAIPPDIALLFRIAARDSTAIQHAARLTSLAPTEVVEAAVMFIQHLLFYPGSNSYRVMGVEPSADDGQIKEHYRWLVRWLHPDRNDDEWDAIYAERVTKAWQDLRSPDRRRVFDLKLAPAAAVADWEPPLVAATRLDRKAPPPIVADQASRPEFVLSTRTARRVPIAILSGVVLCTFAVLALQYYSPEDETADSSQAIEEAARVLPEERSAIAATTPAAQVLELAEPPPVPEPTVAVPVAVAAAESKPSTIVSPEFVAVDPVDEIPDRPQRQARKSIARAEMATAEPPRQPARDLPKLQGPTVASTPIAPAPEVPEPLAERATNINEASANEIILRFRSAYASGNINQVRSLLVTGEGDSREREAVLKSYRKLFNSSVSRRMEIRNASWLTDQDTAVLIASFEAWVRPNEKSNERRINGDILFELRREDGELRILRVRHSAKGS